TNKVISGTPGITDNTIINNILEPILNIYQSDIRSNPKTAFNNDQTKQPKDIIEADKIFDEIKLEMETKNKYST
ncbi:hypothetical protein Mgra_00008691, partial [Meloidogyne graminicola]